MTRLLSRGGVIVAALGLACGWLGMTAAPAAAVVDWGVTSPGPEAVVDGPLDLAVFVEAAEGEQVQGVAVRFLRDGWPFGEGGTLSPRAGPLSAGRSKWGSRVNPSASWVLDGQAMPNGLYDVQTRAKILTSTGGQWTEWRGHAIALQVPPPATWLTARSAGDSQVEVGWRQIQLPDFVRYDVERSADGASWAVVASTARPDATSILDDPPPGMWRYRTRVVRSDGQGGQLATASAPVEVDRRPTPAPGGESPARAAVGEAAVGEAPGALTLPRPPLPSPRPAASLGSAGSQPPAPALPPPPGGTSQEGAYHRTLPYPKGQGTGPQAAGEDEREPAPSPIAVAQSRLGDRQPLLPIAGGLLLMLTAAYVGLQLRR